VARREGLGKVHVLVLRCVMVWQGLCCRPGRPLRLFSALGAALLTGNPRGGQKKFLLAHVRPPSEQANTCSLLPCDQALHVRLCVPGLLPPPPTARLARDDPSSLIRSMSRARRRLCPLPLKPAVFVSESSRDCLDIVRMRSASLFWRAGTILELENQGPHNQRGRGESKIEASQLELRP
jgi:hypothetical protein